MDTNTMLSTYRERLLGSLREQSARCYVEEPHSFQIFVNQECVGALDCEEHKQSLALITQSRPIQTVEIRTAAGLLIASLYAEDASFKVGRFPVGDEVLEVSVHNQTDGGSVRLCYEPRQSKAVRADAGEPIARDTAAGLSWLLPRWPQAAMVTRAGLAAAVLFLVVDRIADRYDPPAPPPDVTMSAGQVKESMAASEHALTSQHEMLAKVLDSQDTVAKTMQAQQQNLARAQKAVEMLTSAQQSLNAKVVQVSDQVTRLKDDTRTEIAFRTRELERGLSHQIVALSKSGSGTETGRSEKTAGAKAGDAASSAGGPPPQMAEARHDPFTFWVSFHDDTPEKSIQDLIREIHGRTGKVDSGWYSIEVSLPERQTPDVFFDSLRKSKIVKSVTTSHNVAVNREQAAIDR